MLNMFYQTLVNKLQSLNLGRVIKGSLRVFPHKITASDIIVVPKNITVNKEGLHPCEVTETYEIVVFAPQNAPDPYQALIERTMQVADALMTWQPEDWASNVTYRSHDIDAIEFDAYPEADELKVVAASITLKVTYYAS